LKAKLGDIEPVANPSIQRLWERSDKLSVEAVSIESERGISLPVLFLKPAAPASGRMPVVVAVAEGGKARFLAQRSSDVLSLLAKGVAVCLPDLRGTGELAETQSRGPGAMSFAATEFMLGDTLLGARLKDFRTVLNYLASRPDIDPARLSAWGESFAQTNPENFEFDQSIAQAPGPFAQHQAEPMGALIALLAGLYDDRITAIAARGGLVSYLAALEDRFCHIPQDVIVPGILQAGDVPDILAALGSKPILLENFVDGRNRPAGKARLQSELGAALANSSRSSVRQEGEPDLASWLASRLQ
jgi:dienelactone hydrolase